MTTQQTIDRPRRTQPVDMSAWRRLLVQGCESCDGAETITVMASDGAWMDIPCPTCAPNDAPGG